MTNRFSFRKNADGTSSGGSALGFLFELIQVMAISLAIILPVRYFLIQPFYVKGASMEPNFYDHEYLIIDELSYRFRQPDRGEIVVFRYPNDPKQFFIKRVIGLPGDQLQITQGKISINEQQLQYQLLQDQEQNNPNSHLFDIYEESFLDRKWRVIFQKLPENKDFGPLVVPPGEVFVLGDNRDASDDSRYWGTVPLNRIRAQVVLIWLSLGMHGGKSGNSYPSVRWERVFSTPR